MQKQNQIYNLFLRPGKQIALLIDPDKFDLSVCKRLKDDINRCFDYIFIGGSLLSTGKTDQVASALRKYIQRPLVLFPGHSMQISDKADAILFLSLVSGRNPEYLIGQHVQAAPIIAQTHLETIPTSYILIDGGKRTSVEYISQSMPIPADKPDIAAATALAGKYLGHKLIYLEAGSGAASSLSPDMVRQVRKTTGLPVIAGGGIRTGQTANALFKAGASVVVFGSLFETSPDEVIRITEKIKFNK